MGNPSKMAKSGKKAKSGKAKGFSTKKAGLKFSPGAIGGNLKRGRFAKRATKAAAKAKKTTLKPRHIALAVRNDDELNKLLATVTIASGGVLPNVHPAIAAKK